MSYVSVQPGSPLAFWQHGNPPRKGKGFGAYRNVGDWSWEFDPFVYSFLAPADSAPQPAPVVSGLGDYQSQAFVTPQVLVDPWTGAKIQVPKGWGSKGMGDCGCGGKCGGCGKHGMGQGLFNTGCFSSTDISTWGVCEWGFVGVGVYVLGSVFGDIRGAAGGRKRK